MRNLAEDSSFHGLVVCEFIERDIVGLTQERPQRVPEEWIREYESSNAFTEFEWRLQILSQESFAFRLPGLAPRTLASQLRVRRLPPRPYIFITQPRGFLGDYSLTDIDWHRRYLAERVAGEYQRDPAPPPEKYVAASDVFNELVDKIQGHGAKVVIVRPPSSGRIWEIENSSYPREKYWNAFASRVSAPTIHFKDYAELARFECPDGVHLDYRDAIPYTKSLVKILSDQGLLTPR
jgi:hypothetical protein